MEKWTWLIVPVTMFVLFVLSQLSKREQEKQKQRLVAAPRREPSEQRAEDKRSDLQRFLDEVQVLRDRAEQKKKEAVPLWSPSERREPAVPELRQGSPVVPQPQRRNPALPQPQPQEVLEVIPVEDQGPAATARRAGALLAGHVGVKRSGSPAAREMLKLLGSPRSLATAWLLKEVFDRPLCMRLSERRGVSPP
jgi:hypothetical protein